MRTWGKGRWRSLLPTTGVLVLVLCGREAGAAPLRLGDTGFALDLSRAEAQVCIIVPGELAEAQACEGVDLAAAAGRAAQLKELMRAVGVARLRFADWDAGVTLFVLDRQQLGERLKFNEMSREQLHRLVSEYIAGTTGQELDGGLIGPVPEILEINGAPAMRVRVSLGLGRDHPGWVASEGVFYGLASDEQMLLAQFMGHPDHVEELSRHADAVMKTATAPRPFLPLGPEQFGRPHAEARWYRLGRLTGRLSVYVVIGIVLIYLAVRAARRPPRRPPGPSLPPGATPYGGGPPPPPWGPAGWAPPAPPAPPPTGPPAPPDATAAAPSAPGSPDQIRRG